MTCWKVWTHAATVADVTGDARSRCDRCRRFSSLVGSASCASSLIPQPVRLKLNICFEKKHENIFVNNILKQNRYGIYDSSLVLYLHGYPRHYKKLHQDRQRALSHCAELLQHCSNILNPAEECIKLHEHLSWASLHGTELHHFHSTIFLYKTVSILPRGLPYTVLICLNIACGLLFN